MRVGVLAGSVRRLRWQLGWLTQQEFCSPPFFLFLSSLFRNGFGVFGQRTLRGARAQERNSLELPAKLPRGIQRFPEAVGAVGDWFAGD